MKKEDLKEYLKIEKRLYLSQNKIRNLKNILLYDRKYQYWKFLKIYRKAEYYSTNRQGIIKRILCFFYLRKKNILAEKLGMEFDGFPFKEGLLIYHSRGIVINGDSKIGKNCILHGENVIGNNGKNTKAPIIGNNVRLGIGSKIIGNVYIANNVTVAAGAIVVSSCYQEGALMAGIPAKIKNKEKINV